MLQKIIYALIPAVTFLFLFASCNRDDMPGTEPGQTLLPQRYISKWFMPYRTTVQPIRA